MREAISLISFGSFSITLRIFRRTGLESTSKYSESSCKKAGSDEIEIVSFSAILKNTLRNNNHGNVNVRFIIMSPSLIKMVGINNERIVSLCALSIPDGARSDGFYDV